MEEAKGFQPSRSAAHQVSRILNEIIWLRFVHFKYLLPLPNSNSFPWGKIIWANSFIFVCVSTWAFRNLMGNHLLLLQLLWPLTQPTKKKRYRHHTQIFQGNPCSLLLLSPWMVAGWAGLCISSDVITFRAGALQWENAPFDYCFGSLWIMNQR